MDDHLLERILEYGRAELIPRLREEFEENGALTRCRSYEEAADFCRVLNIVGKYTPSKDHFSPGDLLYIM